MDRIDFGSIIILSACGMKETFFFSIKFTQQILKDVLDFSYVERTDFFFLTKTSEQHKGRLLVVVSFFVYFRRVSSLTETSSGNEYN